jgi:pantetheine-phosphate adenylyltransferase
VRNRIWFRRVRYLFHPIAGMKHCARKCNVFRYVAPLQNKTRRPRNWFERAENKGKIKDSMGTHRRGTESACGCAWSAVDEGMPRIALYPGSFDPVTNGHLDVVRHAVRLCDRLIVAIGVHSGKKPLFSTQERLDMVAAVFAPVASAAGCAFDCTTYDNLTITAAQKSGATIMIRGLRDGTDLDYEMQIAGMNEAMAPEVHTVFVPASATVRPITATLVRQIATMGGDVSAFVPPQVAALLKTKLAG